MKKMLKIALPLFIIAMFLNTTMVRSDFAVTVGEDNNYDVITSNWSIAVGANSGSGIGFNVEGIGYDIGDDINVEVTAETTIDVDYDITLNGTDTYAWSSSGFGNIFFIAISIFLPLMMPGLVGGTWDQAEIEKGPILWGDFFIHPVMTEAFYEFANNQTALDEIKNDPDYSEYKFKKLKGVFENSTDIAVFDWACDFTIKNTTTSTNWGGIFRWKLAFDQTTGWVKGWGIKMEYDGTYEGTVLDVVWNQVVQQEGYALGNFAIIPGFEWFLVIPVLGLLAIPVIIKRRK